MRAPSESLQVSYAEWTSSKELCKVTKLPLLLYDTSVCSLTLMLPPTSDCKPTRLNLLFWVVSVIPKYSLGSEMQPYMTSWAPPIIQATWPPLYKAQRSQSRSAVSTSLSSICSCGSSISLSDRSRHSSRSPDLSSQNPARATHPTVPLVHPHISRRAARALSRNGKVRLAALVGREGVGGHEPLRVGHVG